LIVIPLRSCNAPQPLIVQTGLPVVGTNKRVIDSHTFEVM